MAEQRTTWIFQANPAKYEIHQSLKKESEELWNCNQHAAKIKRGDRVLIWISGEDAGIYGVGTILNDPIYRPDSSKGLTYWTNPAEGQRERPRVLVKYERVLLDKPLLRDFLQWDPELWNLTILAQPRGTNFAITDDQWQAISSWLDGK